MAPSAFAPDGGIIGCVAPTTKGGYLSVGHDGSAEDRRGDEPAEP